MVTGITLDDAARDRCASVSIVIERDVTFGFGTAPQTVIEAPGNVRRGIYDVEFIGGFTYLGGRETFLRHVGSIGRFCSIASNVVAGQMEHPTDFLSAHPLFEGAFDWKELDVFRAANTDMIAKAAQVAGDQLGRRFGKIVIGNDVWIGEGVFIRRGVTIGDGAIIASRSVVTKDVPPFAIVGGTPAGIIRYRFASEIIVELLRLSWWNYGTSALRGVDFTDISQAVHQIERNITAGVAQPYDGVLAMIGGEADVGLWRYDAVTNGLVSVVDGVP